MASDSYRRNTKHYLGHLLAVIDQFHDNDVIINFYTIKPLCAVNLMKTSTRDPYATEWIKTWNTDHWNGSHALCTKNKKTNQHPFATAVFIQ